MTDATATVGVFGGSGFYTFLDDVEEITLETPFGAPAGRVSIGVIDGTQVTFLPRHGPEHRFPPHLVPAKANLWAMRALGVRTIVGPCAAGSLDAAIAPGDFVVLDQLVDRTHGRPDTYYDQGDAHHVAFADPYCTAIAPLVVAAGNAVGVRTHATGTVVVINGPRFSTHAESRWFRSQGWSVVNMTQYPEAYLARELGIHYAGIALVTDYDTGVEDDPGVQPVTQAEVFGFFEANVHHIRDLLHALVPTLPAEPDGCDCVEALGPLRHA